jgi:hypothetical protein
MSDITITLTKEEAIRLLEYIDFMEEFDDDPDFREQAKTAREKLCQQVG